MPFLEQYASAHFFSHQNQIGEIAHRLDVARIGFFDLQAVADRVHGRAASFAVAADATGHALIDWRVDKNFECGHFLNGIVKGKNAFDDNDFFEGGGHDLIADARGAAHVVNRDDGVFTGGQFEAGLGAALEVYSTWMVEVETAVGPRYEVADIFVEAVGGQNGGTGKFPGQGCLARAGSSADGDYLCRFLFQYLSLFLADCANKSIEPGILSSVRYYLMM
jgi:hypothetical protein